MSRPKVSIVFPFYNCEKFIKEALSSIEYLTSDDFEIIAVNDGSTDNSLEYAQEALRRFTIDSTLISRNHRQGCFTARTEAFKVARGRFIALADADDVNIEGRFEKQLKFLEDNRHPGSRYIDGCGGWAEKIDENGKNIGLMDYPPQNNEEIINKIKSDPTCNPFIDPTMMVDKDILYCLDGYSSDGDKSLVGDMDLWFRALKKGFIFHNMQEVLIKYRINPDGNTRSHQKEMIKQHVTVRNEFIKGL
jgi:glycosyltransferase involved in cell wall biosynthesis